MSSAIEFGYTLETTSAVWDQYVYRIHARLGAPFVVLTIDGYNCSTFILLLTL
jgi:hypothetical protein